MRALTATFCALLLMFAQPAAGRKASYRFAVQPDGPTATIGVHSERTVVRRGSPATARTLQISVWYPAAGSGTALNYGYYFDLAASELAPASDSAIAAARAGYAAFLVAQGMTAAAVEQWFAAAVGAARDPAPRAGRRPLILIAQGNGQSAVDQSPLAEQLASAGFVVATCPSYTRISGPPHDEADLGPGAEEQADDLADIVNLVSKRPDVDARRIGIVGHSLGARGALFLAMRDRRVRALVSLDGGIGAASGNASMAASPSFASRRLRAHVLHFYETEDAFMTPDFTLLADLREADIVLAHTPGLHHHHFTSLGHWCDRVPGLPTATRGDSATSATVFRIERTTVAFMRRHVRGDGDPEALSADFPAVDGRVSRSPLEAHAGESAFKLTVLRRRPPRASVPTPP